MMKTCEAVITASFSFINSLKNKRERPTVSPEKSFFAIFVIFVHGSDVYDRSARERREIRTALPFALRVSTASARVILSEAERSRTAKQHRAKRRWNLGRTPLKMTRRGATPSEKITKGVRTIVRTPFRTPCLQGIVCYTFQMNCRAVICLPCVKGGGLRSKTEGL